MCTHVKLSKAASIVFLVGQLLGCSVHGGSAASTLCKCGTCLGPVKPLSFSSTDVAPVTQLQKGPCRSFLNRVALVRCQTLCSRWACRRGAGWTCWVETDWLILFYFPFLHDAPASVCAFRSVTLFGAGSSLLWDWQYHHTAKMVAFNWKVRMFHIHKAVNFCSFKQMHVRCGWVFKDGFLA